jgi:hypothetical protein
MGSAAFTQNLVVNGGFELPNDSAKHFFITERTGWLSDDTTSNHNGTNFNTNMVGNYNEYSVNIAGTIYQPIDNITDKNAVYAITYSAKVDWNDDAGKDTVYSVVYFSHYTPGTDIKTRTIIDSIATDITAMSTKTKITVNFKIPDGAAYAGDSLVVEFASRVVDHNKVNTSTWTLLDDISVTSVFNLITFEGKLPTGSVFDTINGVPFLKVRLNGWNTTFNIVPIVAYNIDTVKYTYQYSPDTTSTYTNANTEAFVQFMGNTGNNQNIGDYPSSATPKSLTKVLIADTFNALQLAGFQHASWKAINGSLMWISKFQFVINPWTTFPIATVLDGKHLPSYFKANVSLRWDADTLYTKYSVKDGYIVHKGTNNYTIDNIELYFDMFNGKLANWPRDNGWPPAFTNGVNGYYQYRVINDSSWTSPYIGNLAKSAGTKVTYTYNHADSIYTYTVNFLIDSLRKGYTPKVGDKIGFETNVSDNDSTPYYRNQVDWNSPLLTLYCDPASWGTLAFANGGAFKRIMDTQAPSVPDTLAATVDTTSAKLTWVASTDNTVVQNYILYDGATVIDTILAKKKANSFTFKGLSIGSHALGVAAMDLYKNKSAKATDTVLIVKTGINGTFVASFKLNPNPANDFVNINSQDVIKSVEFITIPGQIAKSANFINSSSVRLNISDLQNGVYLVRVRTNTGTSVQRIVKQ